PARIWPWLAKRQVLPFAAPAAPTTAIFWLSEPSLVTSAHDRTSSAHRRAADCHMLAVQTPANKKTEKELRASFEAHKGDFDYLLGGVERAWPRQGLLDRRTPHHWTNPRRIPCSRRQSQNLVRHVDLALLQCRARPMGTRRHGRRRGGLQDVGTAQRVGGEV